MKYKVVLEPQEEGGYTVYVPSLPGCVSQGETTEEAVANIKEAIEVYLGSLNDRGGSLASSCGARGSSVSQAARYVPSVIHQSQEV